MMKYLTCSIVLLAFILQSCSVEKRHYTSGYHLQWKNSKGTISLPKNETNIVTSTKEDRNKSHLQDAGVITNTSFSSFTASSEKKKGIVLLTNDPTGCDTLIMKNGTEVKAKVLEVTPTEIKYKFCNNIDGPLYVAYRYNLSYIKYANGTMDSFVNEHPPVAPSDNRNNSSYRGGYNQNNGGAFNGNNNHYPMDNYATSEYVRKASLGSLICGIASIFIPYLGVIAAIFAIVLGNKSMKFVRRDPENLWMYGRRAMAGQIIGWIVIAIYLLIFVALLISLGI